MYTITFDSGVESISVEEGAVAKEPAKPTKDGYTFVEWLSGETAYDWTAPVTGNLTLTAKWAVEKYTIDYKLPEGSTNDESNLVEYTIESETISELKDPKLPEGLTFLGWYTDENCTVAFESIEKGSTGNVVIYAKYTDKQTFTVTYYIGDKANTKLEEKDAVFTLTGYDLFTDKEGTKAYKDPITSDITLYAKVKVYKVTFNSDGGSEVPPETVEYNKTITEPTPAPTKDGFDFAGWYEGETKFNFATKITKDISLKAKWEEKKATKPDTPAIPTTVEVTKNEDGSFSFADGTYTFVIDGPNPVLKFSMPEEVSCTIGDKLKLTGKINFGDTAVYKQFYIQTNDTAGVPLFGYNMVAEWENGLVGDKTLSLSQTIPDKIGDVTYCTSFKDCKFVLSAPITADDKTLINVTFSNVKMTYEKVDPNAVIKEDISLASSFWGWGYDSEASNADDGSLIITNTKAHGAGSFGYNPTKDWSGYKTLEIVLGDQTEWKEANYAQVTIQDGNKKSVNGSIDVSKTTQTIVIDFETASATIDLTKISQIAVQTGAAGSVIQVTACYLTK